VNVNEFVGGLVRGEFDDDLDLLERALKDRKGARVRSAATVGSIVTISGSTRPAYLRGLKAKVLKVNDKSVRVEIVDEDKGKANKYGLVPFTCPLSLIES
jgi:hypothetical protein